MQTIINGMSSNAVSVSDRGFQYGDGHFTTARVENGHVALLDLHLQRLQRGNEKLLFPALDTTSLSKNINKVARQLGDGVIKVIITRGEGGRGYAPSPSPELTCIISTHSLPTHYEGLRHKGLNVRLADFKLGIQPALAGIKHLNRLEQVLIKQELADKKVDDLMVCDQHDHVIEASQGNVFWSDGSRWFTPQITDAGINGVMRQHLLSQFQQHHIQCDEIQADINQLVSAEHIIICNSVAGALWVARFEQQLYRKPRLAWLLG